MTRPKANFINRKADRREVSCRGHADDPGRENCFNPLTVRQDFPPLCQDLRPGLQLVYLDNAATSLKPWPVVDAVRDYYVRYPASVHRGLHTLSERATEAFESARAKVARWIGAADSSEVVFTRGATESINLVAQGWGGAFLQPGDEVLLSVLEHHSNLVPWQMLAGRIGLVLKYAEITEQGLLDLHSFAQQLSARTRVVAITGMSNVLGTIPPIKKIADMAHHAGAVVVLDAAQSAPHLGVNVADLGADFVAFSGHKMCGPTGIGVLYATRAVGNNVTADGGGRDGAARAENRCGMERSALEV